MKKMGRVVAVVRRCRQYFTFDIMKIILDTLFFSQLDYCQIIWANASKKDLRKLQLVQNKAARLILQCPYRTNINRMHFDLKWLKVEDRMIAAVLLSTWKVLHFKTPLDQYNKLQFNIQSHEYVTRRATEGRFLLPYAKINFLKSTVTFRAMKLWNLLPVSLIRITQKKIF